MIWAMTAMAMTKMAHSLTIGRHLKCAIPTFCQGKGQKSQRAKNRTEPFLGKMSLESG